MAAALGGSSALTGGAAGLAAGVAWSLTGLGRLSATVTGVCVGAALAGDLADHLTGGRARPLALGRQVPQAWGRLFGPRLAATLYGARLGVGPLTILGTWTWWAALVVGASLGPWLSASVGVTFAATRTLTTLAAGRGARTGGAMGDRIAAVVRVGPVVEATTGGLLAATAVTLLLT